MGLLKSLGNFFGRYLPGRKPDAQAWARKEVEKRRDPGQRDWKSSDFARLLPRTWELINNLIRDPDSVLADDPNGYAVIYGDDQIATSLENAFLPIANAQWSYTSTDPNSRKLIPALTKLGLKDPPGWATMIQHLCQARVMGASLIRVLWKPRKRLGRWEMRPVDFTPYDKRQFAISRPEWQEDSMFLIDDGFSPRLGYIYGFAKAVDRKNYIVSKWRNTQDRFGYGQGIGDRLYRHAKWRKPIIHLILQTIEAHAGGVRVATIDSDQGLSEDDQARLLDQVREAFANAISLDTIAMPAGVNLQVLFPPGDLLRSIREMVDGFLQPQISKIINGVTLTEAPGNVGSYSLGQVHAAQQHMRIQAHANLIAEDLDRDYTPQLAQNNPHIFRDAGVPDDTELPKMSVKVPGGHDTKEAAAIVVSLLTAGVDLPKSEVMDRVGFSEVTDEMRAAGDVIAGRAEPSAAPGAGSDPFASLRARIPWHHRRARRARSFDESKIDRDPDGTFDGDGADGNGGDVDLQREQLGEAAQARLDDFDSEGFSVDEARAWGEAGIVDADTAVQWTDLGYGPADVAGIAQAKPIELRGADRDRVRAAAPAANAALADDRVRAIAGDVSVDVGDGGSLLVRGAKSLAIGAAIALALTALFAATGTLNQATMTAAVLAGIAPLVSVG